MRHGSMMIAGISMLAVVPAMLAGGTPAQATVLLPGTSVTASAFNTTTSGTLLQSEAVALTALTFKGIYRIAVYRNTLGTLDFWYQFARTGAGSKKSGNNQAVVQISGSDFTGFTTSVFESLVDPDGAGIFTAASNPGADTTTETRTSLASDGGAQIHIAFGTNNLTGTDVSGTYIFRTNARTYDEGTIGALAGDAVGALGFEPAPVPEPASWAMMVGGFGLAGAALRRRRTLRTTFA